MTHGSSLNKGCCVCRCSQIMVDLCPVSWPCCWLFAVTWLPWLKPSRRWEYESLLPRINLAVPVVHPGATAVVTGNDSNECSGTQDIVFSVNFVVAFPVFLDQEFCTCFGHECICCDCRGSRVPSGIIDGSNDHILR